LAHNGSKRKLPPKENKLDFEVWFKNPKERAKIEREMEKSGIPLEIRATLNGVSKVLSFVTAITFFLKTKKVH